MKKLAIFVEGYTELLFIDALLTEIAGSKSILIEHRKIRGGATVKRSMAQIKAATAVTNESYFVMIFDCGGDEAVKSRIQEEHERLTNTNYSQIIGLRDVRPTFAHGDLPRLELGLRTRIRTALIPVDFILAVLEVEAWFLAEFNHYPIVHPAITTLAINARLGFDPSTDDMSLRNNPADDLNNCYQIGGQNYVKGTPQPTIGALDYAYVYLEMQHRIPYLARLINLIDSFLSPGAPAV